MQRRPPGRILRGDAPDRVGHGRATSTERTPDVAIPTAAGRRSGAVRVEGPVPRQDAGVVLESFESGEAGTGVAVPGRLRLPDRPRTARRSPVPLAGEPVSAPAAAVARLVPS